MRKLFSDDYKYAGVATRLGEVKFRASTRPSYADKLRAEGDKAINIVELPSPMTKPAAALYLSAHADFQAPETKAVLLAEARGATPIQQHNDETETAITSPSSSGAALIARLADQVETEFGARPISLTMKFPVHPRS